jgi:hypothetical protein
MLEQKGSKLLVFHYVNHSDQFNQFHEFRYFHLNQIQDWHELNHLHLLRFLTQNIWTDMSHIETDAFSKSSDQLLVILSNFGLIGSSVFPSVNGFFVHWEYTNAFFLMIHNSLIVVLHCRLIREFSNSMNLTIPDRIKKPGFSYFSFCQSLSSILFQLNSWLTQFESLTFAFGCHFHAHVHFHVHDFNQLKFREMFGSSRVLDLLIFSFLFFFCSLFFTSLHFPSISLEPANAKFVLENGFLINILHYKSICNFLTSSTVRTANTFEIFVENMIDILRWHDFQIWSGVHSWEIY